MCYLNPSASLVSLAGGYFLTQFYGKNGQLPFICDYLFYFVGYN